MSTLTKGTETRIGSIYPWRNLKVRFNPISCLLKWTYLNSNIRLSIFILHLNEYWKLLFKNVLSTGFFGVYYQNIKIFILFKAQHALFYSLKQCLNIKLLRLLVSFPSHFSKFDQWPTDVDAKVNFHRWQLAVHQPLSCVRRAKL